MLQLGLMDNTIYLDYNASTPVHPKVLEAMLPYFGENFGNPANTSHSYGWDADKAVETARAQVAKLLNCHPHEIYFTSGATEASNWAVQGLIQHLRQENPNEPIHLITSPAEHNSVVRSHQAAAKIYPNVTVTFAPVNQYGQVESQQLEKLITPHTKLISLMWVNNEIGSTHAINEIGALARKHKIYFHSDATQAVGKLKVDLGQDPVDMISFSGHKFYGPKGTGALYIRNKDPKVRIAPMILGGGHERGMRSGTLNVPAIVGLGKACEIAMGEKGAEYTRLKKLRDSFWAELQKAFPGIRLNGHPTERAANNLNVTFLGHHVPMQLHGLAASKGSACLTGAVTTSHVLNALGVSEADAGRTLRLSMGAGTTEDTILAALNLLKSQITVIRQEITAT